jgi:multiple sugar transport system substrate-binding protein
MWRKTFAAVAVAGAAVSLTACSGDAGNESGQTVVSYAFWGNNEEADTIKSMIAAFEEEYPDITVEANWIQNDYEQNLQTSIAGGNAPTLAQISNTSLPSFASAFQEVDVDKSVYYSDAVSIAGDFEGKTYAVPFVAKSKVMAINAALFESAGLPLPSGTEPMATTQFVADATALTSGTGAEKIYGSAPLWYDGWLLAEGGSYYSADGTECTMGNPDGIRAAEVVVESTTDQGFAPNPIDAQGQDMFQWFADGKVAMLPDFGPWNISKIAELDPAQFQLVPMPGLGEPMEVDSLGISRDADEAETAAATTFATFMATSPEAQGLLASPESALGVPVIEESVATFLEAAPEVNLQTFVDAVERAVTIPYVKDKVRIESTFSTDLNSRTGVGTGTEDVATVLPELQAQCQEMLDAANS